MNALSGVFLVNDDGRPHMQVMASIKLSHDMKRHAAAIARWDDEGGAPMRGGAAAGSRQESPFSAGPASATDSAGPAAEEKILECLGVAVTMRWGTLPTKIQRELFEHATAVAAGIDAFLSKSQVARFLHGHAAGGRHPPDTEARTKATHALTR